MLIPTRELIQDAQTHHYALGAFNVYNLELVNAVLQAATEAHSPVLLQLASGQLKYGGYDALVGLCLGAARAASIPVALHLDHGPQLSDITRALDAGFSSVMVDGSRLSFEENVTLTRQAVALAHAQNKIVEAELGRLAGSEDAAHPVRPSGELTDPLQAMRFVTETRIDLLAVCIGNVHGFYVGEPSLDLARLDAIREVVNVPIVIHGTSGLLDETVCELVQRGVVKFNLNTELRIAFFDALERELALPHPSYDLAKLMKPVNAAIVQLVARKLALFGSAR